MRPLRPLAVAVLLLVPAAVAALPREPPATIHELRGPHFARVGAVSEYVGELKAGHVRSGGSGVDFILPVAGIEVRLVRDDGTELARAPTGVDGRAIFPITFEAKGEWRLRIESDAGRSREITVFSGRAPAASTVDVTPGTAWDAPRVYARADADEGDAPLDRLHTQVLDLDGNVLAAWSWAWWWSAQNPPLPGTGAYLARSWATNAYGAGPATTTPFEVLPPPAADVALVGPYTSIGSAFAPHFFRAAHEGATVHVPATAGLLTLNGIVHGSLTRGGAPLAGDAARASATWTTPTSTFETGKGRSLSAADGSFLVFAPGTHVIPAPPPGVCQRIEADFEASYPGSLATKAAGFTLCRSL